MFRHKSDSITKGFLNECPTERLSSIFSTIKPYPKHALFQFIRSLPTLKLIFEAAKEHSSQSPVKEDYNRSR